MSKRKEKKLKQEKNADSKVQFLLALLTRVSFFILVFLLIFFTINNSPSYAQTETYESDLVSLEEKIFHQRFTSEDFKNRLSRLEKFIFGKDNSNISTEQRLNKIKTAIDSSPNKKSSNTFVNINPQDSEVKDTGQKIENKEQKAEDKNNKETMVYDDSANSGVFGAISKIEEKVFNKAFNDLLFEKRVDALEKILFTKNEQKKIKEKPILERVAILLKRAGFKPSNNQKQIQLPQAQYNQNHSNSYNVDQNTGFLINDQTGEILKDNFGNPIMVKLQMIIQNQPDLQNYDPYNGQRLPYQGNDLLQNLFLNPGSFGNTPGNSTEDYDY